MDPMRNGKNTLGSGGDDLMNLGPFIQSYVFNTQPNKPRIPFMPRLESIENDNNVPPPSSSPGLPMRATRSRAMLPVSVQQPTVVLKRIDEDVVTSPVKGNSLPLKKRHWDARKSIDKLPWISKKPKLLNEKQARIKRWLLANYVYCPRHRNAKVSSRLVLNRAIKNFGPMTQKALGYIMYHAFPGVERVKDTRRGHIFKGILDKKDLSVRYKAVEVEPEEPDDPMEDLEKMSQDGPPGSEKSDDSEDPPYTPPTLFTQNSDFKIKTRGATRKDVEPEQKMNRHQFGRLCEDVTQQQSATMIVKQDNLPMQQGLAMQQQRHNEAMQIHNEAMQIHIEAMHKQNEARQLNNQAMQQNDEAMQQNNEAVRQINEAMPQNNGQIKTETSDQGYDSNNSEENQKRLRLADFGVHSDTTHSNDDEYSPSDDTCSTGIKIKKEQMDQEYEPLSSTDEGDDHFLAASPNLDANAFMLHNPLTFPLLRRTLGASPINSPNPNGVPQRSVPSPGFLPMSPCQTAVPKHGALSDMHRVPSPLVRNMPPQQLHSPQLQYQMNEQVACPSVQQSQQLFHSVRIDEQNMTVAHKMPQSLHEAQAQVGFLLSYIQTREKKFSDLEKHFCDVSNEFRKLSHSFKQFQTERAAFLDFMNPPGHET